MYKTYASCYLYDLREKRSAVVQWFKDASLSRGRPGFDSRARRRELLGVKTWLSTLEIVNLCVFG